MFELFICYARYFGQGMRIHVMRYEAGIRTIVISMNIHADCNSANPCFISYYLIPSPRYLTLMDLSNDAHFAVG